MTLNDCMAPQNVDQWPEENFSQFRGPLFIVGMQRSGTKLLRELLNGHPQIAIPPVETNCLPYWAEKWDSFGDLSERSNFSKFYRQISGHPYFLYTKNQVGPVITEEVWYQRCQSFTVAEVFEALIRHDTGIEDRVDTIWGDKSPPYLTHLPLLKQLFPDAKFIHIVRDVRDYCLSLHKAWNKNMLRAAQRWNDSVIKPVMDAQAFPEDYLEVKYEQLLDRPEHVLHQCCDFLNIPFVPSMVYLTKVTENIGDAKGDKGIRTSNKEKYMQLMEPKVRRKIEAIATTTLQHFGYDVEYSGSPLRLSKLQMMVYQIVDGINFLKSEARREGLLNILAIELGALKTSR